MIYMLRRDVSLLNFHDARILSEKNCDSFYRGKNKKKKLSLNKIEAQDLEDLCSKSVDDLTLDDKIYLQKLFILSSLYEHINKGTYIAEFILPFPLIPIVKDWVSAKGYAISPTPIDYSYSYIDEDGFWKFHEAKPLDPAIVCNYRILW